MNRKAGLYAVIGGIVGAVLTMAVCSFLPLGVQSQSAGMFDAITCTSLTVTDDKGFPGIRLNTTENGGAVQIAGGAGLVVLSTNTQGGQVWVGVSAGASPVLKELDTEQARFDWVTGKENRAILRRAAMAVKDGNGVVNTWDKNGYRLATLK